MTTSRAAWLTIAVMVVAAWGAAAAGARWGAKAVRPASAGSIDPVAGGEARTALRQAAADRPASTRRVSRDLFRFAQPVPRRADTASAVADAALQALTSAIAAPQEPRMRLLGLAEASRGGLVVRTAVLSVDGELVLAREGDLVAGRFRLVRITAEAAHLEDAHAGPARVLRLR